MPKHDFKIPSTVAATSYALLVVATVCAALLSCVALLSQAVRTAPNRSWRNNFNALVIGASYLIVVSANLFSFFDVENVLASSLRLFYSVQNAGWQCISSFRGSRKSIVRYLV